MEKRRILAFALTVVLVSILAFAGCTATTPAPAPAPTPAPAPAPTPTPAPAPTPAPSPTPAQPAEVINWTGQQHSSAASLMYLGFARMSEKVTAASGGRLTCEPNPAGSIVPAMKEFDGVDAGLLDYGETAFTYWKDKFPAAALFTFRVAGLSPIESLIWYVDGGGAALAEKMISGYNVKLLPGVCCPPEIFLSSSKELNSMADLKGLKIRTAGDDGEMLSRMGAAVVSLPSGEIYESMQRGVIDAYQCSSPAVDWTLSLQEVADYIYISGARQPAEYHSILVNTKAWAELPDDLKVLFEEENLAEAIRYYIYMTGADIEALEMYKDYGCTVQPIPKDIEDELMKQAEIFYDEKSAEDALFAEVLESQRAFQKAYREGFPRL